MQKRTFIYIDGFNLYFRALQKNPQFKWLNPLLLAQNVLRDENLITGVRYYTADVTGRLDPSSPGKQRIYLNALQTVPNLEVIKGEFLVRETWAPLAGGQPGIPRLKPSPEVVKIIKTEEKGSDVNLGAHLVRDAFLKRFDVAAIITNDTDLVEPIRIVTEELGLSAGIISPTEHPAQKLQDVASFMRRIRPDHLRNSQFPNPVITQNGEIEKPDSWVAAPED